jgi:subtilisin-like proprotein convertase family protein
MRTPVLKRRETGQINRAMLTSMLFMMAFLLIALGYRHSSAAAGGAYQDEVKPTRVRLEVLPGEAAKVLDRRVRPVFPLVIYSSENFDATQVDPATISVSDSSVMRRANGKFKTSSKDVNGDGLTDLLVFVWTDKLHVRENMMQSALFNAKMYDGKAIHGEAPVTLTDSTPAPVEDKAAIRKAAQNNLTTFASKTAKAESATPITPETVTFSNPANIQIPASPNSGSAAGDPANPYPSLIAVSGFTATQQRVGSLVVKINGFNHNFPDDVDMLLVGPTGARIVFWSDVGGSSCVGTASNNPGCANPAVTVTIDDGAAAQLPDGTLLTNGTFKPTDVGITDSFPAPAPCSGLTCDPDDAAPAGTKTLTNTFAGTNPDGQWSLYVVDDTNGDTGNITGGWTLSIVPVTQFSNPAPILVPAGQPVTSNGISAPYPSTIAVAGQPTTSGKVRVVLNDVRHTFPDDIDILLVGPTGANAIIMSDVGGSVCAGPGCPTPNTVNLTLDDNAIDGPLPDAGPLVSGIFQPTNVGAGDPFAAPAPAPTGGSALSIFQNTNPNGTWSLYVVDDNTGDFGSINGGWGLQFFFPTAAAAIVSGQVTTPDGEPLAGAVINLSGPKQARTITDAQGNYKFENVDTGSFYTVSPMRANFAFSPAERSFSLNANKTDAVFTANPLAEQTANPLDTDMYFVRQQYVDFLGREADNGGLQYWTSELDKCGTDALCLNQRRIGVSAAFFIESEPQQTGSFVYRLYKAALGRQLSYHEFSSDRQQVIGGANLDASRAALAEQFVQRAEFEQKYAGQNSAESFVDALVANVEQASGVDLSGQRGDFINKYKAGADINESRSFALREAIEQTSFKEAEYNPSFVLMEYFGYLKRDPDADGYKFWLNVLNNKEPGNYRGMVCSFITSTEYQSRFSSFISHSNRECGQ